MKNIVKSPLYQKMTCWEGYTAEGKKEYPSGKKTAEGNMKLVNNSSKQ